MELPTRLGAKIASLVGADPDEIIVCDSTTVNFYKLASAALEFQRGRRAVVSERKSFPTNNYVLQKLASEENVRYAESVDGIHAPPDTIEQLIDENVALLCLNHVNYLSGWLHDMKRLNFVARDVGLLNLWDLSHSVGVVPIDLHDAGTDLAVGCTYKYLNGGPGAPAFLFVRRDLQKLLGNPIQGWFGRKEFFHLEDAYEPELDIRRFLTGTPPILSMVAVEAGLDLVLEAGIDRIRTKSLQLSEFMIKFWEERLEPIGMRLRSPRAAESRGSHVSLAHDRAMGIDSALIHRMGVIPDFRKPDNIRFGLAPLYTRHVEVFEALERMRLVLENRSYEAFDEPVGIVT